MTQRDEEQLQAWLGDGPQYGPVGGVETAIAAARSMRQRPAWMVAVTGGTIGSSARDGMLRSAVVALTIVALVAALVSALIVGGVLPSPLPIPSASPALGVGHGWTLTGPMVEMRRQDTATLLPDGRVLVAGGAGDNGAAGSAELYDPGTRN